jgi:hypothetical protein
MSNDDQENYIKVNIKQRFIECQTSCINFKCGVKQSAKKKVCRISNVIKCLDSCDKAVTIIEKNWITYSNLARTGNRYPQITINVAW